MPQLRDHKKRFYVDCHPHGRVPVWDGQSLLDAFIKADIPLLHECNGQARCSTCRILVLAGEESLTPRTDAETRLDGQLHFPSAVRLACQTYCHGNFAKVGSIIRDVTDINLYNGKSHEEAKKQIGVEEALVLFFLDIRNYTHFVETQLAFDVIHIVRRLFMLIQSIVTRHQGQIVEIAGDGIYAVFGLNQDLALSASSAVEAAYSILIELKELNENYFLKYFDQKLSIGIGIHQGLVIKGTILLDDLEHMIVMGYPVNVASRLQNATKEVNNDFVISEAVYSLLPTPILFKKSMTIQLRGVTGPLSIYLLGNSYLI